MVEHLRRNSVTAQKRWGIHSASGIAAAIGCSAGLTLNLMGRDGEEMGPRLCVIAPLVVPAGTNTTLRIRGQKLAGVSRISVHSSVGELKATITEKKTVEVPNGFEAKDVGDSLAVVDVSVPAGSVGTELVIRLSSPEGTTPSRMIRVVDGAKITEEKEPNDGFREAQLLTFGREVWGVIGKDRDVDVYTFSGHAQKKLVAEVVATSVGSLLDGVLTLYDDQGRVLIVNDDYEGHRDPKVRLTLPTDGKYFLAVQDANDHGTAWHGYQLSVWEEP